MSCLFHSFAILIGKDHYEIRKEICDYLQDDNLLFDNLTIKDIAEFEGMSKEQYINSMRQYHTWGGAPEIKAFCEIYNTCVKVLVIHDNKEIEFTPKCPTQFIKISWNGSHFEPLL
jgi:hypothetical protein